MNLLHNTQRLFFAKMPSDDRTQRDFKLKQADTWEILAQKAGYNNMLYAYELGVISFKEAVELLIKILQIDSEKDRDRKL